MGWKVFVQLKSGRVVEQILADVPMPNWVRGNLNPDATILLDAGTDMLYVRANEIEFVRIRRED